MAPQDRQERRRLRERGAGITRDLRNANFAFTFGSGALPASRSSRKTPQPTADVSKTPATARARSSKKTPASRSARRQPSSASQSAKSQTKQSTATSVPNSTRSSRGRGKPIERASGGVTPGNRVTPLLPSNRERDGATKLQDTNEEDELEKEDAMEAITGRRSWGEQMPAPRRKQSLGNIAEAAAGEDELDEPSLVHEITHVRRSISGKSIPPFTHSEPSSGLVPQNSSIPAASQMFKTPTAKKMHATVSTAGASDNVEAGQERDGKENETHSTFIRRMYKPRQPLQTKEPQPRKRKRLTKSLPEPDSTVHEPSIGEEASLGVVHDLDVLDANIDPSLDDLGVIPNPGAQAMGLDQVLGTPLFVTPGEKLEAVSRRVMENSPVRGRKKRRTGSFTLSESTATTTTQPGTMQSQRKTKKKRRSSPQGERRTSEAAGSGPIAATEPKRERSPAATQRGTATTVPITVYRLCKAPALDESGDELNEASTAASSARLPAVNPVDVLTQITTEIIEHMAETAHRLPRTSTSGRTSNGNRKPDSAELKRKRAILHHFKQVLSDSLFDITTALDAGSAFSSRLKALTKEKIQLREELLGVRRQREDVALKVDRVRREHAAWREKTTNRDELSMELWDLEMAVKNGREHCEMQRSAGTPVERPQMDMEMLAASAAEHLGAAGRGGGLRGKIQKLNDALEERAAQLEGRPSQIDLRS